MNIKFQHDYYRWADKTTAEEIAKYLFDNRFDNPRVGDYQTDDILNRLFYQEGSDLISFQFIDMWETYKFADFLMDKWEERPRDKNEEDLKDLFYERVDFLYTNYIQHD